MTEQKPLASRVWSSAREFIIIVIGVLAALAAQAWWQSRDNRALERSYMRQLHADMVENERRALEAIEDDSISGLANARALEAVEGTAPVAADSFIDWMRAAGSSADFTPVKGTLQALMSTGDIRLIRNDSVRTRLISYAAFIDSETARNVQIRGVVMDHVDELARAFPFMRGVFGGTLDSTKVDMPRMRSNDDAAVTLFALQAANANRSSGFRRLLSETRELKKILEAEPAVRQ